jgi:hypothetical protein
MLSNEDKKREDKLHEKGVKFLREASKEEQLRLLWMMCEDFYFPTIDRENEGVYYDSLMNDTKTGFVPVALNDDGEFIFHREGFVEELLQEVAMKEVNEILDKDE